MRKNARRGGCKKERAPAHEVELALALHAEGMGYKAIAKKLERSQWTVAKWVTGQRRREVGAQD